MRCILYESFTRGCLKLFIDDRQASLATLREKWNTEKVLDLWQAYSDFVLYAKIELNPKCYIKNNLHEIHTSSGFIDDNTLCFGRETVHAIVLTYFDRIDRVTFWNSMTKFRSLKTIVRSMQNFHPCNLFMPLTLFIHQYL
jgi:hypothetical protein